VFGLDEAIASWTDGAGLLVVALVAVLLGVRHAADPDHVAAVTAVVASGRDRAGCAAARLGAFWGLGHAVTLYAFGLPIVCFEAYLPERAQQAIETAVGVLIVGLAAWILVRWRRGTVHTRDHVQGTPHTHARTALGSLAVGLLHGAGGSAGVGVLLVATIEGAAAGALALAILAVSTAVAMTVLSAMLGAVAGSPSVVRSYGRVAPALGAVSLAFGVWYALGALSLAPYYF
jgi:High-affinity nickel-transport protein